MAHKSSWREGQRLYAAGWLEAAGEQFKEALEHARPDALLSARIMDAMGRIAMQRNRHQDGIAWFRRAHNMIAHHDQKESLQFLFAITTRLNMALSLGTDEDRALRGLQRLEPQVASQPQRQQAIYHLNLGVVYLNAQLYPQGLVRLKSAQDLITSEDMREMSYPLHTNLGIALIALGRYEAARDELLVALQLSSGKGLHALNELTRLAILMGDEDQVRTYGQQAIDQMWGSLMTFEKSELANLCEILAQVAVRTGETSLCRQLIDTAQTLYGQIGVWRHWRRLQKTPVAQAGLPDTTLAPFIADIRRFLQWLQMMLAQDILHEKLPAVADVRTQIAEAMAVAHQWDINRRRDLTLVSRLADVGLTAIDYDVVHDPEKTPTTWMRYTAHPGLSLQLLASLKLPDEVMEAIGDHHEQPDGQGFPQGKTGPSISPLAAVFGVAHAYTWNVVYLGIPHTRTLELLKSRAPHQLPQDWVNTLVTIFDSVDLMVKAE